MSAHIHHVVLTVSDIEASVEWYKDVFGFAELTREEHHGGSGGRTVLLGKEDWSMGLGLAYHPTNGGETFDPTRTGLDHVGFTVADRDTLVEFETKLADKGVKYSAITDHDWGSSLNFRDPDDVQLQIISFASA